MQEEGAHFWAVPRDNLHIIKIPVQSECRTVLYQLKLLYLISWFNYELVNWKIHGTSSEGQNTQKFKEDWSICFTQALTFSAELQKSALIQTGKLILGLNNWITKQEDNSLPPMRYKCVHCQTWLDCDWFICLLWLLKDPRSNYSCRDAASTVLSAFQPSQGCLCWYHVLDWWTCRLRCAEGDRSLRPLCCGYWQTLGHFRLCAVIVGFCHSCLSRMVTLVWAQPAYTFMCSKQHTLILKNFFFFFKQLIHGVSDPCGCRVLWKT